MDSHSDLCQMMQTRQAQERETILLKYATEKSIETAEIPLEEVQIASKFLLLVNRIGLG